MIIAFVIAMVVLFCAAGMIGLLMRPFYIIISWLKSRIMRLYYSRTVTQPNADFIKTYAIRGQQTGECVSHSVWSDPGQRSSCYVIFKRSGEIVSITVTAMCDCGLQHKWFSEAISLKKLKELSRDRNGAFFSVLEIHRTRFPQMQKSSLKVKPERTRFYDLILP